MFRNRHELNLKQPRKASIILINELFRQSIAHWGYSQEELKKIMNLYSITTDYLKNHLVYLVFEHKKLIGFFSFTQTDLKENELDYFFINHKLIGKGYGKKMWEVCCEHARSVGMQDFLILSNPNAIGFYYKLGAEKVGSRASRIFIGENLPLLRYCLKAIKFPTPPNINTN